MLSRRFSILTLPLLFLASTVAQAGDKQTPPTLVVRVRSIDTVVDSVKLVAAMVGQNEAAKQIEGLIKTKIGEQGLEGVDTTRPLGGYARLGKELDDVSGAILIPIADEKAFLDLLKNLGVKLTKGQDDIYTIQTGSPVDAYLRFANKYAYVTALNTAALDAKNLLDPAKVLAGKATSAFSATVRLDQVPDAGKLIAIAQLETQLQAAQEEKVKGETETQKAFRIAALKEMAKTFASVLREGAELKGDFDLDKKSGRLSVSFSLSGQPKTDLAEAIEGLAKNSSQFGALAKKDSIASGLVHFTLPQALSRALDKVRDEATAGALASIRDENKKKQAEAFIQAITPTLKAGDLDMFFAFQNSSGEHSTMVLAVKVKEGAQLGKTVHGLVNDLLQDLPPAQRDKIKLDATAVGDIKIHRLELPDKGVDAATRKLLGELNLYIAIREDAVFVTIGKDAMQAIKDVLTAKKSPSSPVVSYEIDVARLATALAPEEQAAQARKLFPNREDGLVRISVEGGSSLTANFSMPLAVLQFLSQVKKAGGE